MPYRSEGPPGTGFKLYRAFSLRGQQNLVIDKETGSFNFTKAADEKNAESLLILRSKDLAQKYIENWKKHKGH